MNATLTLSVKELFVEMLEDGWLTLDSHTNEYVDAAGYECPKNILVSTLVSKLSSQFYYEYGMEPDSIALGALVELASSEVYS